MTADGSKASDLRCPLHVCFVLSFGRQHTSPISTLWADFVAKVENRTTLKISRELIFVLLCCCVAFQRRYGGPWSIWRETMWSLTSPRIKRISGPKNFRSTPQKDFCNKVGQERSHARNG